MSVALLNHLLQSYGYFAVFAFIALESLGLPLPGETTLIAAAVYAGSTHHLNIGVIALVATCAAIVGDNGGYWLGRRFGARLAVRYGRWVRLDARKLKIGRYLFARHGGKVVFLGRFLTLVRAYAAFLAGMNGMRRSRFLAANALGAVVWAGVCAFGAYALGSAAAGLGTAVTLAGVALALLISLVLGVVANRSMRQLEQRAAAMFPDAAVPAGAPEDQVSALAGTR